MGFWAAVPLVGSLIDSLGNAVDKVVTSDEERLTLHREMMSVAQPVLQAIISAQAEFDKMRTQLELASIASGDPFVRRVRPGLMVATFCAWFGIEGYALYLVGPNLEYLQDAALRAFGAFGIVGGLFTATRGIEKAVGRWAEGKNGNGNAK